MSIKTQLPGITPLDNFGYAEPPDVASLTGLFLCGGSATDTLRNRAPGGGAPATIGGTAAAVYGSNYVELGTETWLRSPVANPARNRSVIYIVGRHFAPPASLPPSSATPGAAAPQTGDTYAFWSSPDQSNLYSYGFSGFVNGGSFLFRYGRNDGGSHDYGSTSTYEFANPTPMYFRDGTVRRAPPFLQAASHGATRARALHMCAGAWNAVSIGTGETADNVTGTAPPDLPVVIGGAGGTGTRFDLYAMMEFKIALTEAQLKANGLWLAREVEARGTRVVAYDTSAAA